MTKSEQELEKLKEIVEEMVYQIQSLNSNIRSMQNNVSLLSARVYICLNDFKPLNDDYAEFGYKQLALFERDDF